MPGAQEHSEAAHKSGEDEVAEFEEIEEEPASFGGEASEEADMPEPSPKPAKGPPLFADPVAAAQEADEEDYDDRAKPFDLTGMQAGDDMGEEEDDVDEIIDPLAGLRGAEEEPYDLADEEPEATGSAAIPSAYEPDDDQVSDRELFASADRLNAEDKPVEARLGGGRRRGAIGGGAMGLGDGDGDADGDQGSGGGKAGGKGGGARSAGSTLFERMANLSRSSSGDEDDEDEDDDDAPALSIPRFLGRQNNQ
jgi:cell division protein FtsZ